jgi:hypothetical protein
MNVNTKKDWDYYPIAFNIGKYQTIRNVTIHFGIDSVLYGDYKFDIFLN